MGCDWSFKRALSVVAGNDKDTEALLKPQSAWLVGSNHYMHALPPILPCAG
jgi:uncharacterized protein YecT (DUF1311 family)